MGKDLEKCIGQSQRKTGGRKEACPWMKRDETQFSLAFKVWNNAIDKAAPETWSFWIKYSTISKYKSLRCFRWHSSCEKVFIRLPKGIMIGDEVYFLNVARPLVLRKVDKARFMELHDPEI